ncbi:phospholipase D-like domain-containing protein [Rhizobium etli]|uniref:phospholipase D-like domain-containing protein n=1 Tax=Rhizobium etli TaxID=29449 RepID=UPI000383A5AC|nr:phospholipase D-like domain-containing protein [Rhizobium etli]AGS25633.1 phospholipase D domain-containing protein [Rhizobium etli bv. mimosae str. Mim1]
MRFEAESDGLRLRVIAGTHVVLMVWDIEEKARNNLRGFAIQRWQTGRPETARWLEGIKYFPKVIINPVPGAEYSSREQPFQTFLWSDYEAYPGQAYTMRVVALYGDPGGLEEGPSVSVDVKTEPELVNGHGVWFNRGAIASHAYASDYGNQPVTDEMANDVDGAGQLKNKVVRWLSRGLAEACLAYINGTVAGDGLRVCAYEFTYEPVLVALKRAIERGVDVRITYHFTKEVNDRNRKAIDAVGIPDTITVGGEEVTALFPRTRTRIPHNKFIVKLVNGSPAAVWFGSTNFTNSGFFGQTNVGHIVEDHDVADRYLRYWTLVSQDLTHKNMVEATTTLTPNPQNAIEPRSIVPFFSPRIADNMLDWYGDRIRNAANFAAMTIPFNVAPAILKALDQADSSLRLVILEDTPSKEVEEAEDRNKGMLAFSNGAILGKTFIKYKSAVGGAKVAPIPNSELDKWFIDEELSRPTNSGHVFFIHSKFMLVDPLSDDPLICSGSANFSSNSLEANDENMLLIRGNTRVADIYLTEFDRIFRHFYARNAINEMVGHGEKHNILELDTGTQWITNNQRGYKKARHALFFPISDNSITSWAENAKADRDPFSDELERAEEDRHRRSGEDT